MMKSLTSTLDFQFQIFTAQDDNGLNMQQTITHFCISLSLYMPHRVTQVDLTRRII